MVSGSEKERKSRRHGGGFRRGRVHDEEGNSDLSGRRKYERENKRGTSLEEMREGVNTWRIVEAEEEPESLLLRRWRCRPRRWASERPRVIRRLAGGNHRTYGGGFLAVSAVLREVV